MKFSILFLSLPRHDEKYTSTPWQLAEGLAARHEVFFADNPFTVSEALVGLRSKAVKDRIKAYFGRKSRVVRGVTVILTPFVWPINFLPAGKIFNMFTRINQRLLARRISGILKEKKVSSLVYINSFAYKFPHLDQYLDSVSLNVYHCIDPMTKAYTLRHGRYLQENAARRADLIISTAPSLRDQFKLDGYPESLYVANAANFDLFSKALQKALPMHPSVSKIEGRTFGFLGNIERRTDFILLKKVVDVLTDWTLVMAGPVEPGAVPAFLVDHERVVFTGPVSHADAPSLIKRFDVCIIPFKCDAVSNGIYPLKLYEYLATGKPVVTTNFNPEVLHALEPVISVAHNAEHFAERIKNSYESNSELKIQRRVEVARQNSWPERVAQFEKIIDEHLKSV